MAQIAGREPVYEFTGGHLCLDFTNTVGGSRRAQPKERLTSYQDLIAWGRQGGVLTEQEARELRQLAARRPADAAAALEAAVALRETIYRIFLNVNEGRAPEPDDLSAMNAALCAESSHVQVKVRPGGFAWAWCDDGKALDRVLWPVVRSAADLLVSGEVQRVRKCAAEDCDWLFFDVSRNNRRRWCDMKSCGNRAKARRYYARKKAAD